MSRKSVRNTIAVAVLWDYTLAGTASVAHVVAEPSHPGAATHIAADSTPAPAPSPTSSAADTHWG
jgi:hypothetical protein